MISESLLKFIVLLNKFLIFSQLVESGRNDSPMALSITLEIEKKFSWNQRKTNNISYSTLNLQNHFIFISFIYIFLNFYGKNSKKNLFVYLTLPSSSFIGH